MERPPILPPTPPASCSVCLSLCLQPPTSPSHRRAQELFIEHLLSPRSHVFSIPLNPQGSSIKEAPHPAPMVWIRRLRPRQQQLNIPVLPSLWDPRGCPSVCLGTPPASLRASWSLHPWHSPQRGPASCLDCHSPGSRSRCGISRR